MARSAGSDGVAQDDARRMSTSPSTTDDVGDEEYDLTDFAVADGFRPNRESLREPTPLSALTLQNTLQIPSVAHSRSHSPSPSHISAASSSRSPAQIQEHPEPVALAPGRPRQSSISKPRRPHESLTLRNDGQYSSDFTASSGPQSVTTAFGANSSASALSSTSSHPFALYGQRTTSENGTSTDETPGVSDYTGPRGPTHPYSLYPQGTAPLSEPDVQPIPIGFNGLGGGYQRQLGPDGEEAGDLIGPDGHLEELPPYSRYPEPSQGRSTSAEESRTTASGQFVVVGDGSSRQEAQNITNAAVAAGAGGIGIATRNPEFSSTEENLSVERSVRSVDTMSSHRGNINVAARDFAEKLPDGKWRRRARRKCLGVIPYWAICLLVVSLIIIGIVMGTVLGILLSDSGKKKPDGDEFGVTLPKPSADVSYLSEVPPGLKPLPVGLFDLPSLDVSQAPRSCFNDTTQAQAWTCDMPFRYYSLEIGTDPNASDVKYYNIQLEAIGGPDAVYVWGTQPPNIPDPVSLRLVNDSFEPGRGPAWWREVSYDKQVIISESSLESNNNEKRDWTYTGNSDIGFNPTRFMSSKPGPAVGENAWICTWPNVTMEIFIYPNQNASSPSWGSASSTSSVLPTSTTNSVATASQTPYDPTPVYPKVIKFLERRLTVDNTSTAAICRKVKIIDGGRDCEPVLDDDGEPITVVVTERRSTMEELLEQQERARHPDPDSEDDQPVERKRAEITQVLRRETLELTDCGCLWWST